MLGTKIETSNIKSSIKINNLTNGQRTAVENTFDCLVVRETEKAVQVLWSTKFGNITMWCPKSCIGVEVKKAKFDAYEEYLNKAKELGVKGIRNKMKMATIQLKALEQGIQL